MPRSGSLAHPGSSGRPARSQLAERALSPGIGAEEIKARQREIRDGLLAESKWLHEPDFKAIHPADLGFLFRAYDKRFLDGLCARAVAPGNLSFRLSQRMTRAAGKASCIAHASGKADYELAVSATLLFDGFGPSDRDVTVAGLPCASRLEALQRIFEHELVHLIEFVAWKKSNCRTARFHTIATRLFGHREYTHQLITRRERAAAVGIVVGSPVSFVIDGRRLVGRVNRVTKRATVLVSDPRGEKYRDGNRYAKYYVPLPALTLLR